MPEYDLNSALDYSYYQMVYLDENLWNTKLKVSFLMYGKISIKDLIDEIFLRESYFKNRQKFEYVDFIQNGQVVYSGRIGSTMLSIGISSDGSRGCILYDTDDSGTPKEVYRSKEVLTKISTPVPIDILTKYTPKNDNQIFLSPLLDDYILYLGACFDDVLIKNGSIEIVEPLKLIIGGNYFVHDMATSYIQKYADGTLVIMPEMQFIDSIDDFPDDEINLYYLLSSQGLLEDADFLSQHSPKNRDGLIVLTMDELSAIIENYISGLKPKTHILK